MSNEPRKAAPKFCRQCGLPLIAKPLHSGYHPDTGKPTHLKRLVCSKYEVFRFEFSTFSFHDRWEQRKGLWFDARE